MEDELLLVLLQRATHVTLQVLGTELSDLGLTASEVNVLATLTGVLDRLEQKGHIQRAPRPGDRRAVEISLTSVGVESAGRVQQAFAELEERALAGVATGSVKQARRVLTALGAV